MTQPSAVAAKSHTNPLDPILAVRKYLNATFPEREEIIDGIIMSLLAGEHVVLLGPPGAAKTAVAEKLADIVGLRAYRTLLSRFTTPPEIFGPLSLKGLENDEVVYMTSGMLPEAEIAVIDEIFKAGTALLNSLLALINERTFFNGTHGPRPTPLRVVIGASNEMPQGEGLEALWDRFLLRYEVGYVRSPESFRAVVRSDLSVPPSVSLTTADLDAAQAISLATTIPDSTIDAMYECRGALQAEGVVVSDRRWKKSLKVAQAASFLDGAETVEPQALLVLAHSLWREPKEKGKVAKILAKILDSDVHTMREIVDAANETLRAYEASPMGVKESATFGKQLRGAKDKAEAMMKKAPARRQPTLKPMVDEITVAWKKVIRLAAESAGVSI